MALAIVCFGLHAVSLYSVPALKSGAAKAAWRCLVEVGDLVMVGPLRVPKSKHKPFVSVIVEICLPEDQRNGMHLIKVVEQGTGKWYPAGYIKVISKAACLI